VFEDCGPGEDTISLATIVDAQCTVPGLNPYGKVSGGYLVLRVCLAYLTVACHTPKDCWAYTVYKQDDVPEPMTSDCQLIEDAGTLRRASHGEALELEKFSVETPCVPIRKITGEGGNVSVFVIVLQKLEADVYGRIGCTLLDNDDWFDGASEITIRVV
jgi:hypothetical protein